MKVLLTHRYFAPDSSPYGIILRQISEELAKAGHQVKVFTSRPSYGREKVEAPSRDQIGSVIVRRVWVLSEASRNPVVRLVNTAIYCFALFIHTLNARADVVTACTFPPVLAAWSASLAARLSGARFIYHMQDIHPEVSVYSGGRLGRPFPARILRWLDNQTLRRSSAIVTLSSDMAKTLAARGLGDLPIHIINNPPLRTDAADTAPVDLCKLDGRVRVIFAGNLGRFQNLPLLAEGVAQCFDSHPELELMFLGDGVALPELKARWGDHPQVRFAGFLPFAQAKGIIAAADVGLVSLSPNIYRVAYPSKIATYRDLGLKILALVEPQSEMARELEAEGLGAVPRSATPGAIAAALEGLLARMNAGCTFPARSKQPPTWPELVAGLGAGRNTEQD